MPEDSELPDLVFSPWQRRQGVDTIVTGVLRYPLQRRRWLAIYHRVQQELSDRADLHRRSPADELWLAARTAFSLSLPHCPPIALDGHDMDPGSRDSWARVIRRQINDLVTEDVLGLDWRQPRHRPRRSTVQQAERRIWVELDLLLMSAHLSQDERALVQALKLVDGSVTDAANALNLSADAAWQRLSRLRKKILR
jgi:hypothetical protein